MTNLVENAWRAGADQCLMKASTTPAQLFDAVDKAMQKAAARASAPQAPGAPVGTITPLAKPVSGLAPALAAPVPVASRPVAAAPVVPPVTPIKRLSGDVPMFIIPGAPGPVAPAPVAPVATERAAPSVQSEVDPEFQAQIRQLFVGSAPGKLAAVRDAANAFVQDQGSSMQLPLLMDLFRKVHSLTGNAAVAGCARIAHYASMFEAFLQELQQKPKFINASAARTIVNAVTFVELLFQRSGDLDGSPARAASVLVVDGDAMSSQAIGMALEKAEYQSSMAGDPAQAIGMMASGAFEFVVMGVNLPGMNGFELCAQMQAFPACAQTPVLFVTALDDFQLHSNPEVLGENEVIAAPYLLIELTLKAVTQVEVARMVRLSGGGSATGLPQAV